jgi:hypothetical protein
VKLPHDPAARLFPSASLARRDDLDLEVVRLSNELKELRADVLRGLNIANELTPETQTVEEACADLVRLVREARAQRDNRPVVTSQSEMLRDLLARLCVMHGLRLVLSELARVVRWASRQEGITPQTTQQLQRTAEVLEREAAEQPG